MDRPIFIDNVLGLQHASMRQIVEIVKRTYCGTFALQYMHISNPEQAAWLLARADGAKTLTRLALLVNILAEAHQVPASFLAAVKERAAGWPGLEKIHSAA
jgi:2-oxoglutarate dehydrogenase complex dehydrogenase (E1) component-like enzyme